MSPQLTPSADVQYAVDAFLEQYLDRQAERMAALGPSGADLLHVLRPILAKGKRTRATLCWWGYELGLGAEADAHDPEGIVAAAAAIELFHAAALVHDDIIDHSTSRRGQRTVHTSAAAWHAEQALAGDPADFGTAAGIVAGDLCLGMSEDLFTACLLTDGSERVRHLLRDLRTDVMVGQYLDVLAQAEPGTPIAIQERAWSVLTLKTAKYSVQQPLLIGAALARAAEPVLAALATLGLPLGQAYQLRDDLLGVYGDPATTGKPAGDDLREGKRTLLLGYALEDADAEGAHELRRGLGSPTADIGRLRDVIDASGAPARVEGEIDALVAEARAGEAALLAAGAEPAQVRAFAAFASSLVTRTS